MSNLHAAFRSDFLQTTDEDHYILCLIMDIALPIWLEQIGFLFMEASYANSLECGVAQGSRLGPLLFSVLTNDVPLTLNKACVFDDSTVYT
jgi:hypothetical protein